MGEVQGQGNIGLALGWADVLATADCHAINIRPEEPQWEGRNRFLLSHGHYAIAHYAALIQNKTQALFTTRCPTASSTKAQPEKQQWAHADSLTPAG